MTLAARQHASELLLPPNPSNRVVRRTEQKELWSLGYNGLLKLFQVYRVNPIPLCQRMVHRPPSCIPNHSIEGIVYRDLDQNTVTRRCDGLNQLKKAGNNARCCPNPLPLQACTVLGFLPTQDAFIIGVWDTIISKCALLYGLVQRIPHTLWRLEIHVSHPEGQQVHLPKGRQKGIPLGAIGAPAIQERDFP